MPSTHGGKREGAGRPSVADELKGKKRSIRMTDKEWELLKEMAASTGRTVSEIIRDVAKKWAEETRRTIES